MDLTNIAAELKSGQTVISFTKGRSMEPLLIEGKSYVVLKPVDGLLKVGDLPLFRRSVNVYVLHRLIGIDGDYYITRGDNCIGCEKTHKDKFVGVVTEIVRNGKTIRVTDKAYQRYVSFWMWISPVRIPLYKLRAVLRKFLHLLRVRLRHR